MEAGKSPGTWSASAGTTDEIEPWHKNCITYTSPWSPCSTSCGLGVSTRISNVNARCWPEQESRLCNLRPCDMDLKPHIKVGPPPREWQASQVRKICWRRDRLPTQIFLGFPGGSAGKESACSAGDLGLIPGLGRFPREGKGYPLQYSSLENSMDCILHGVKKSWTQLERLSLKTA